MDVLFGLIKPNYQLICGFSKKGKFLADAIASDLFFLR